MNYYVLSNVGAIDLVSGKRPTIASGTPVAGIGPYGRGALYNGSSGNFDISGQEAWSGGTIGYLATLPLSGGTYKGIYNPAGTVYLSLGISTFTTGAISFTMPTVGDYAVTAARTVAGPVAVIHAFNFGGTTTSVVRGGGVSGTYTNSVGTPGATSTNARFLIGNNLAVADSGSVLHSVVQWSRVLSTQEMKDWVDNPWILVDDSALDLIIPTAAAPAGLAAHPMRGGGAAANPLWGYV